MNNGQEVQGILCLELDIQPQQKTNRDQPLHLLPTKWDSRHQRVLNMKVSGIDGLHVVTRWANERIRCTRTNDLAVGEADDRPVWRLIEYIEFPIIIWLVVSTPLKNISQNGNLPQVGVKNKKHLTPPHRYRVPNSHEGNKTQFSFSRDPDEVW